MEYAYTEIPPKISSMNKAPTKEDVTMVPTKEEVEEEKILKLVEQGYTLQKLRVIEIDRQRAQEQYREVSRKVGRGPIWDVEETG